MRCLPRGAKKVNCHCVEYCNDLLITTDENIMVVDNGCNQSIISINSFLVKSFAGELFNVGVALHNIQSSQLELVSDAFTLVTLPDNSRIIFKTNQCFLIGIHCSQKS